METFQLSKASSVSEAIQAGSEARYVAGGTTLIDLMKLNVERPRRVIDINKLPLNKVEQASDGSLRIGALVRNSDLAYDDTVQKNYAVLSEALLSGASAQLRNMATTGGNLLQRTRCVYFRDVGYSACNKRAPGSGCSAIGGYNRMLAILGTSDHCIASNPSDMAVAMMALEAQIHMQGPAGDRVVPIAEFYTLPGDTPHIETVLKPGELITYVTLPPPRSNTRSVYLKLRDRASYEFALASAAVVASVESGRIRHVRVAMGGVGARPWRSLEAERSLEGKSATPEHFAAAAAVFLKGARPQSENAFKVELAKRCLIRTLSMATEAA
jgi:xanthine dehydrogenase YagS FAD-binding subunit